MSAPKPKVQFSIRIPEEVIKLLDEIAENTGLNITRNNVVEQAAEWYVRTYRANGNRALTNEDFNSLIEFIQGKRKILTPDLRHAHETMMAAEEPGNISELPVPGSSPAKTPIRYQPKKRKSLN